MPSWNTDAQFARTIDDDYLFENTKFSEFLSSGQYNQFIIVASKGMGKTLLLWHKPENFYDLSEYDKISPESFAKALKKIPKQTLDAVKKLEENPKSDDAMFEFMDNIFPEDIKQHIVHMLKNDNRLDIADTDDLGNTHRYEIITKQKGISFGIFSPGIFLSKLDGTNLVRLSGDRNFIHLSRRGKDFSKWLIEHEKDAEIFNSTIGSWGVEQNAMDFMKERFEKTNNNQAVDTTP